MTAYCGANDIRRALTGDAMQTGGTNTAADLDDNALQDSANEATAIVDAYLDGPYDTTVDKIPAVVRFWTRDIAAYLATLVWRKSKSPAANDPVVLRYQNAMGMLEGVAEGKIAIDGPANVQDQPTVVNPNALELFPINDFDLFGASEDYQGWPLQRVPGGVIWPGYVD